MTPEELAKRQGVLFIFCYCPMCEGRAIDIVGSTAYCPNERCRVLCWQWDDDLGLIEYVAP